jgi:hypothetical protein
MGRGHRLRIAYDFRIGPAFELTTSPAVELSAVSDITAKSSEIETVAAKVGAAPLYMFTSAAEVTSRALTAATEGIKARLPAMDVTI